MHLGDSTCFKGEECVTVCYKDLHIKISEALQVRIGS